MGRIIRTIIQLVLVILLIKFVSGLYRAYENYIVPDSVNDYLEERQKDPKYIPYDERSNFSTPME